MGGGGSGRPRRRSRPLLEECGRAVHQDEQGDACGQCGEPFTESVIARRDGANGDGTSAEPLVTEVVYQTRFIHEVNLVVQELEDAAIPSFQLAMEIGRGPRTPALAKDEFPRNRYIVEVPAADAARAREIVAGLPVSHDDEDGGDPWTPHAEE